MIEHFLKQTAEVLIPKRLHLYAQSKPVGHPHFIVIDELPAIVKKISKAPEYLDTILKEGRKVGVYLISAAQDFLVKTIGGTGAVRDCYRTAYYVGGDDRTAKVLLDATPPQEGLGKGVVYLRNASARAVKKAQLAYVPFMDNESLYELLGPSTYVPEDGGDEHGVDLMPGTRQREASSQIQALRRLPYAQYLKTEHWQKQRKGALARARGHCQVCRAQRVQLEVHHNTYERLGCEQEDDLLVLCDGCHALFSEGGRLAGESRRTEEVEIEEAVEPTIMPNIPEEGSKAEDIDIDVLVAVWNGGGNSVLKLMRIFKFTNHQAQKARKRIMEQAGKHIDEAFD